MNDVTTKGGTDVPHCSNDIDWTMDYADGSLGPSDENCDIQDLIDSIEFFDEIYTDIGNHPSDTLPNYLTMSSTVGQATCETSDTSHLAVPTEKIDLDMDRDESYNKVQVGSSKRKKGYNVGPSHRNSKKKPKGLPKRPLSAYNLFFQSERLKIFEEGVLNHQRVSFEGLAKLVGQRWQSLDEETREELRQRSQLDITRYRKEMSEYHRSTVALDPSTKKCPLRSPSHERKRRSSDASSVETACKSNHKVLPENEIHKSSAKVENDIPDKSSLHQPEDICNYQNTNISKPGFDNTSVPVLSVTPTPPPYIPTQSSMNYVEYQRNRDNSCMRLKLHHRPLDDSQSKPSFIPSEFSNITQDSTQAQHSYPLYPRYATQPSPPNYCAPNAPFQREVKLFDYNFGMERSYKIEYKCFAMKRSDAYKYVSTFSRPDYYGNHCVAVNQILQTPPPPGIEVPATDMPRLSFVPIPPPTRQPNQPQNHFMRI